MITFHSDTAGWWLVGIGSLPLIGGAIARLTKPKSNLPAAAHVRKSAQTAKPTPKAQANNFNWDRIIGLLLVVAGLWRLLKQ